MFQLSRTGRVANGKQSLSCLVTNSLVAEIGRDPTWPLLAPIPLREAGQDVLVNKGSRLERYLVPKQRLALPR